MRDRPGVPLRALIVVVLLAIFVLASWLCLLESPRENALDLCTLMLMLPAVILALMVLAILGRILPDRRRDLLLVPLSTLDPPPRLSIAA